MLPIKLLAGLVYAPCVVIAAGRCPVGDHVVTYERLENHPQDLPALDEAGVDDLIALQNSGSTTSVELVKAHIARISEVNHVLHAVSEINPDALDIARVLDKERAAGRLRGPLHGIPILIKDNIATKDRMNNTAGSYALVGATVQYESTVVTKLRDAGAVILGKATMGEWAQMRSRRASSSHGWSAYSGQALAAYYPQQDPSGSSSGSAVAPSVGLALGALGTETSGSIVLPAERSNIVGIKPTLGLTSRRMVIPISMRQDSVGPMARTVKDAAYLLNAIAGKDKGDNWTSVQPFEQVPNYVKACDNSAFKGARLGVPRNGITPFLSDTNAPIMLAFEEAIRTIIRAGAKVFDATDFAAFDVRAFQRNSSIVLDTDFIAGISDYFGRLDLNPNNLHSLGDLAQFTRDEPKEECPDRDLYVWERELALNITNESQESFDAYEANLKMAGEKGVIGTLEKYDLDALVMPTFASFHLPAIAGLPIVTVPLGFYPPSTPLTWNLKKTTISAAPQIPFGIAFVGRRWSEETLIALAYAFEQHTMVRQKMRPYVAPTFELGKRTENHFQSSDSCRKFSLFQTFQALLRRSKKGLLSMRIWDRVALGLIETLG